MCRGQHPGREGETLQSLRSNEITRHEKGLQDTQQDHFNSVLRERKNMLRPGEFLCGEETVEKACPAFKGWLAHAHRCLYSYAGHVIALHIDHVGLKDPGWLRKLPEHLMVHAKLWNLKVPVLVVARQCVRVLATLSDRNDIK